MVYSCEACEQHQPHNQQTPTESPVQAPIPPSSLPPHNAPQIDSERGLLASWRRLSTAPLLGLLWLYQRLLRPNMPPLCRFYPSCSDYAVIALKRHGLIVGTVLTTWRLMRCQPLCTGGVDLVPERGHIHLTHCRCSDENQTQKQQQP